MPRYEYAIDFDPAKSARAQAFDIDASYKDMTQVCQAIEGKSVKSAIEMLDKAISMERPIAYRQHAKGIGHKKTLGGKKGRYPKKECKLISALIQNAVASALAKGLEDKDLVLLHCQAYKQNTFPRYRREFASSHTLGYGKQAVFASYTTARMELAVGTKDAKRVAKKTKVQLKAEAKLKKSKAAEAKKEQTKAAPAKAAEKKEPAATKAVEAEKPASPKKAESKEAKK